MKEIIDFLANNNLKDITKAFSKLGITICNEDGTFKSFYEVMHELSYKYNQMIDEDAYCETLSNLKKHIDDCGNDYAKEKYRYLGLNQHCISSEDVKYLSRADEIFCDRQIGFGGMLLKDNNFYGYIDGYEGCLGSDIIIKKIVIYKNKELSDILTERFKGKILIFSNYKDNFIS